MNLVCSESIKVFNSSQPNNTNLAASIRTAILYIANISTVVLDTANMLILWKQKCSTEKWKQYKPQGHLRMIKNSLVRMPKLPDTSTGHPNIF